MSLLLTCPVPSELTDIPVPTCFEDFGQISKALLQRLYSSGTTLNKFTIASANPNAKASWDPLIAASDNTKVTICPQINNSDLQPGDEVTFGGGDATVGGAEKIVAVNPSTFTGELHRQRQDVIEALKTYMGEVMGTYLVNEHGFVGGLVDNIASPTEFYPIPVIPETFFVSDKQGGKRESPDMNRIRWQFYANWSNKFYVVNPTDFNGNTLS